MSEYDGEDTLIIAVAEISIIDRQSIKFVYVRQFLQHRSYCDVY